MLVNINKTIKKITLRNLLSASILIICATVMSANFSRDSSAYHALISYYIQHKISFWQTFNQGHEAIFIWLSKMSDYLDVKEWFVFFIYALSSVVIKVYLIDRKSKIYWLSLGFYVSYFFLFQDGTAIRASLAVGLLFLSLLLIENGKSLLFFLSVLLISFLVHYSALLFLFMLVLKYKRSEYVLILILFISYFFVFIFDKNQVISFFVSFLGGLNNYFYGVQKLVIYLGNAQNSTEYYSPFKLQSFIAYFWAFIFWFYRDKFSHYEMLSYKAFLFSLILFVVFSYIPGWQQRFSDIFAFSFVFLIPYSYEFFNNFLSEKISLGIVSMVCLVLFFKLAFVEKLIVY